MILVDATPLQSEHRDRGLGTYVRFLTRELAAQPELDVRFLVTAHDQKGLPDWVLDRTIVMRRSHRPAQVYWIYNEWSLRRTLRRYKPDVFLSTDFNGLISDRRYKTVAIVYDLSPLKLGLKWRGMSQFLSSLRWTVYFKQKLPKVDHIFTISESVKVDLMTYLSVPPTRVTALPPGFEGDLWSPQRGIGRFANHDPYLAYVGGCDANKNLERVLTAFSLVHQTAPELRLLAGGRWQAAQEAWFDAKVQELGLDGFVQRLGYIDHADLISLYSNAMAYVFASLEEGLGIPILEAMACGVPVVTSNCSVLPETADGAALLVDPRDARGIASGILSLIEQPELRHSLSERGLSRVQSLSWSHVARVVGNSLSAKRAR